MSTNGSSTKIIDIITLYSIEKNSILFFIIFAKSEKKKIKKIMIILLNKNYERFYLLIKEQDISKNDNYLLVRAVRQRPYFAMNEFDSLSMLVVY